MDTIKYKYTTLVCHAYVFCYGIQPHLKQLAVHHLYTSKLSVLKRLLTCFEINIVELPMHPSERDAFTGCVHTYFSKSSRPSFGRLVQRTSNCPSLCYCCTVELVVSKL